jgi:protein-S-isoprenylcysteine O-methyltransferase Ste14
MIADCQGRKRGKVWVVNVRLMVKAVLFTLLFPGVVTVLVPYLILGSPTIEAWPELSLARTLAAVVGMIGGVVLLQCIWGFAFYGKGTLAPISPPELLVTRGPYRYARNPMYLAVLSVLAAESLFFRNSALLMYAVITFFCFHLFVLLYEEPHLRNQFGQQYLDYCRRVPRWGFTLHR